MWLSILDKLYTYTIARAGARITGKRRILECYIVENGMDENGRTDAASDCCRKLDMIRIKTDEAGKPENGRQMNAREKRSAERSGSETGEAAEEGTENGGDRERKREERKGGKKRSIIWHVQRVELLTARSSQAP